MKIVDINLLIYAINKDTPHHSKAKKWLEDSLSSDEPLGFAWIVIIGFLRIVTNGRIMPAPLALSLIHISEPTRLKTRSRMPSSA